ncbi:uncharacterized protein LOC115015488 isoform X2 [Cottoperca gobio]|uniref:Uncharacterized protein LOC115015488 isoform X2 n=1 Tax=Cottoperca gobio TaxID=56716 RepID=A0A6J2QMX2_COTGO|nr:uncharacterized protein LOC115015488 isoform X2 [Cottoperca gobio]
MEAERRVETVVRDAEPFRTNAFLIIDQMLELFDPGRDLHTLLVDEILHSIFFLGNIHVPPFSPQRILGEEMFNGLRETFPRPFKLYSSQVPKRSPFSCLLDMIVDLKGQENEQEIIAMLQNFISKIQQGRNSKPLVSSTICVSQSTDIRYYGVSMSTSGRIPGKIMVSASCFSSWDEYVAGAVITYHPAKDKKTYFDGTIILPETVRCQAFSLLRGGSIMPPCRSCENLFGLTTDDTQEWGYGNCAEAESVSNLFKKVQEVREEARPTSTTCTPENRMKAEEAVKRDLKNLLKEKKFNWDNNFYTPERV